MQTPLRITFQNTPSNSVSDKYYWTAGTWSDTQIDWVDRALAGIESRTGNAKLLKTSTGKNMTFKHWGTPYAVAVEVPPFGIPPELPKWAASNNNQGTINHNVGNPYYDLGIDKNWNWGALVPGGEVRYQLNYQNRGNLPITTTLRITDTLPANATFAVARAATIQSAQDLYGGGSAAVRAVTQAWTAVGVQ